MRHLILFALLVMGSGVTDSTFAYLSTPLDEIENPGVPVVQPTTTIPFNQQSLPGDIALSGDGQHLVYSESTELLDLWAAMVHRWPELLLGLTTVIVLWRLWVSFRRRRRFPSENGPYCAKCAYPTQGLDGVGCPECGNVLKGAGTTAGAARQRLLFTQLILLGFAGLIGVCYTLDPPRDIFLKRWITWHSEGLVAWANSQDYIDLNDAVIACTSVRLIPVDDPGNVKTICHVRNSAEFGFMARLVGLHTFLGPRPHGFERMMANSSQTYAGITTADYYAVIDLETLRASDAGRLKGETDLFKLLSDDGETRLDYGWIGNKRMIESELLDGSGDQILPHFEEPVVKLTIGTRGSMDWSSLGSKGEEEPEESKPAPYQQSVIELMRFRSELSVLYHPIEWLDRVRLQVQADYVLLLGSQSVLIFDLKSNQWLAQLDLSPITAGVWQPDGTSIAVSADRSTVAVINDIGSQVATYDLP